MKISMVLKIVLACSITSASFMIPNTAQANGNQILTCSSNDYEKSYCYTSQDIFSANIRRQLSSSICLLNDSWGYYDRTIWVDDGCRAEFIVNFRHDSHANKSNGHSYNNGYSNGRRHYEDDDVDGEEVLGILGLALLLSALDDEGEGFDNNYRRQRREDVIRKCVRYGYESARQKGAYSVEIINPETAKYQEYGETKLLRAKFLAKFPGEYQRVNISCEVQYGYVSSFNFWED